MDESAQLKGAISRAADLQRWDPRITILAEYPMFRGMKRQLPSFKEKWGTFLCDRLRILSMIHLRMKTGREGSSERRTRGERILPAAVILPPDADLRR